MQARPRLALHVHLYLADKCPKCAAQVGIGALLVILRPQEGGQLVATQPFRVQRQVGQQSDGFARVHFDRLAVPFDARRAKQVAASLALRT